MSIVSSAQNSTTVVPACQITNTPQQSEDNKISASRRGSVEIGFGFVIFLSALDSTIVTTCLPYIASDLGDLSKLSWVGTSFQLTSTAMAPIFSKLSDFFGRKPTLFAAIGIFLIGSALCGASTSMTMLIIMRAIQGVGAAGLLSLTIISISEIVSLRERGKYQGILSACVAVSLLLGPVVGGIFTDTVSWRWAFYVNLFISIIPIGILSLYLRLPAPVGATSTKLKRIDYAGSLLLIAACIALLLPLAWGGHEYAWTSAPVIVCFVLSGVLCIAFLTYEAYLPHEPIIPLHLFKYKNFAMNCLAGFAFGFVFYGQSYITPQYFEIARQMDATQAGLRTFAMVIPFLSISAITGQLVSKWGRYVEFFKVGSAIAVLGFYLISRWDLSTTLGEIIGFYVIVGVGIGPVNAPQSLIAQTACKPTEIAVATSTQNFLRTIGGTVGIAVLNTVLNQVWFNSLVDTLKQHDLGNLTNTLFADGQFNTNVIATLDQTTKDYVLSSFVRGFKVSMWVATGMMGLCFLSSLFLAHVPLRTSVVSQQVPSNIMQTDGSQEKSGDTFVGAPYSLKDRSDTTSLHQITVIDLTSGSDMLPPCNKLPMEDQAQISKSQDEIDLTDLKDNDQRV